MADQISFRLLKDAKFDSLKTGDASSTNMWIVRAPVNEITGLHVDLHVSNSFGLWTICIPQFHGTMASASPTITIPLPSWIPYPGLQGASQGCAMEKTGTAYPGRVDILIDGSSPLDDPSGMLMFTDYTNASITGDSGLYADCVLQYRV